MEGGLWRSLEERSGRARTRSKTAGKFEFVFYEKSRIEVDNLVVSVDVWMK